MSKVIHIEGMSCTHCTSAVETALRAIAGVDQVRVDLKEKTATVEASQEVSDSTLASAIEDIGFDVVSIQ